MRTTDYKMWLTYFIRIWTLSMAKHAVSLFLLGATATSLCIPIRLLGHSELHRHWDLNDVSVIYPRPESVTENEAMVHPRTKGVMGELLPLEAAA